MVTTRSGEHSSPDATLTLRSRSKTGSAKSTPNKQRPGAGPAPVIAPNRQSTGSAALPDHFEIQSDLVALDSSPKEIPTPEIASRSDGKAPAPPKAFKSTATRSSTRRGGRSGANSIQSEVTADSNQHKRFGSQEPQINQPEDVESLAYAKAKSDTDADSEEDSDAAPEVISAKLTAPRQGGMPTSSRSRSKVRPAKGANSTQAQNTLGGQSQDTSPEGKPPLVEKVNGISTGIPSERVEMSHDDQPHHHHIPGLHTASSDGAKGDQSPGADNQPSASKRKRELSPVTTSLRLQLPSRNSGSSARYRSRILERLNFQDQWPGKRSRFISTA